jgi:IS5 family transposase
MARLTGSSQPELIPRCAKPRIPIDPNHRLVRIAELIDWTLLLDQIERLRRSKVGPAGRRPHLRALVGAMIFMAVQKMTFRQAEDLIRHYGPARYLCGLTETDWTPDFTTLQDFNALIGEDGMQLINEHVVRLAEAEGLVDTSLAVADMTAQEAAIPYPNEMGLMSRFFGSMGRACKRAGGALKRFWHRVSGKTVKQAKRKIRKHRLFARTEEIRKQLTGQVAKAVEKVQAGLGKVLESATRAAGQLHGAAKSALAKACELHQTMGKLLPQIRSWLATGRVAAGKIISLHMPQVTAIVRGKAGKKVEFGWRWGILRLGGGFVLGRASTTRSQMCDARFAVEAVEMQRQVLGQVPERYAYDRGGWSETNVKALRELGVKHVGLAPRGRAKWAVDGEQREQLFRERTKVEGSIGAVKSSRYAFNRPPARSVAAMKSCGQRSLVGFNLNKLVREMAGRDGWALTG